MNSIGVWYARIRTN